MELEDEDRILNESEKERHNPFIKLNHEDYTRYMLYIKAIKNSHDEVCGGCKFRRIWKLMLCSQPFPLKDF